MDAQLKGCYEKLLSSDYCGIPLWERITTGELTCAPHFVGTEYAQSDASLMIVGRAMNGWEASFSGCESAEAVTCAVLAQENPFQDVGDGKNEHTGNYTYRKSGVWKLIKALLAAYGEADPAKWEGDETLRWYQRILWSNLYKVSPRTAGNPDWALIKPFMEDYIEIIKREIELYRPKRALFVTGLAYFDPWKRRPSFVRDMLGTSWNPKGGKYIVGGGQYLDTSVLVCTRPDRRGTSNADIERMAEEIKREFDS